MPDENLYYLAFSVFEDFGPVRFKLLLDHFGSAKSAYKADKNKLEKINLPQKILNSFLNFRQKFNPQKYYQEIKTQNISFISLTDPNYPKLLKEIPDPPIGLYVKGQLKTTDNKIIAVVGSRKISPYGKIITQKFTYQLVKYGFTIVSGLALGVDAIAHQTAINANGKTIAVLACGVDVIYPSANKFIYQKIIKTNGAVISEFPPQTQPKKEYFPIRNRIISGLSLGVLITQGAKHSGTLITASYATNQGREVFAVPGPITSPLSCAPADLIKKGAKLVYNIDDILDEL